MATNFPSSLDAFTNPTSTSSMSGALSHAGQHSDVNDAVEALQAKVGADSSAVTSSHDYKIADHASRIATLEGASGGKILQVVQATKNDTWSAAIASAGSSAITDLAVTITPSSATSTILLLGMVTGTCSTNGRFAVGIHRGATVLGTYDSPGLRTGVFGQNVRPDAYTLNTVTIAFEDSPASTSAQTYQAYAYNLISGARTYYVNRTSADDNNAYAIRTFSNLIALEVEA